MFQYTKETILNTIDDVLAITGVDDPYTGVTGTTKLVIKGIGEYYKDCLVGTPIKTAGKKGNPGKLTLPVADLSGEKILTFKVITPNQFYAEYASPNWQAFGKPILVNYNATTAADIAAAIELAIPEGNKFITVTVDDANIVLEGTSNYMTFTKANVEDVATETVAVVGTVETNVEDFATKNWIIENLRFPTYPNIRYASASTMPTAELYTEYSFAYRVPRTGLGGLSGVGQDLNAVTRHIFYVPSDLATSFDTILTEAGFVASADVTEPDVEPDNTEE